MADSGDRVKPIQWRAGRGAKTQRGRQNWSKALVKTFVTIRESDDPMKEKWTEFYRDLRSVWQCLCLCVWHTTLTTTATPCARATFPNSVILTDQLTSWFPMCQIFRQFGSTHDQITYCRKHCLMCLCAYFACYFFSVFSNCSKDVKLWIANLLIVKLNVIMWREFAYDYW